jgi:hypothetical protein
MSNYTKTTNFAAKDALSSGDSAKIVKGTEIDSEFTAIATAIATKLDSGGSVSLTSGVTGTLPIANGGTGATTFTTGSVLVGNGTSIYQQIAPSTSGNVLTSNGTTWVSSAPTGGGGSGVSSLAVSNSVSGMTVSVNASTGAVTLTTAISSGSSFRSSIGAAASGANADITSLTGLTTSLAVGYGGTGSSSLTGAGIVTTTDSQTISGAKTFSANNGYGTANPGTVNGSYTTPAYFKATSSSVIGAVFDCQTSSSNAAAFNTSSTSSNLSSFFYGATSSASNVGSITTNGSATAYNTTSDYRLKENVTSLTGAIDRLKTLMPKRFTWKANPSIGTVDGFIAHELQSVVPDAVHGTKDAVDANGHPVYQGIDTSVLVPLLTAALQEAIARIETLEGRA